MHHLLIIAIKQIVSFPIPCTSMVHMVDNNLLASPAVKLLTRSSSDIVHSDVVQQ